ncbi:MAG TPA: DUF72 domain-containing protein [Burkholderiales bacterium]|nr:DUF72 domain-containing protein [Burkholderiales bacterium]
MPATLLIGTAGWTLPREMQARFPGAGTHLERYARVFRCVEINSTFHRPHRASTFARWAASVPAGFRFALKIPKNITHAAKLAGTRSLVEGFLADIEPLGTAADCLLVQLPPKLELEPRRARAFFSFLRDRFPRSIACEPRHASWFTPAAERLLRDLRIARVAAHPSRGPGGAEPGGWNGLVYYRLHGFPRVYYSSYDAGFLDALAGRLQRAGATPTWCIFDNTTLGAGTANALSVLEALVKR